MVERLGRCRKLQTPFAGLGTTGKSYVHKCARTISILSLILGKRDLISNFKSCLLRIPHSKTSNTTLSSKQGCHALKIYGVRWLALRQGKQRFRRKCKVCTARVSHAKMKCQLSVPSGNCTVEHYVCEILLAKLSTA